MMMTTMMMMIFIKCERGYSQRGGKHQNNEKYILETRRYLPKRNELLEAEIIYGRVHFPFGNMFVILIHLNPPEKQKTFHATYSTCLYQLFKHFCILFLHKKLLANVFIPYTQKLIFRLKVFFTFFMRV